MQRFGDALNEFEATVARQTACVEDAARVVITPIPYWICGVDTVDLYSEKRMAEWSKQVRTDVTIRSIQFWRIVFAIVRAGRVVLTSEHDRIHRSNV